MRKDFVTLNAFEFNVTVPKKFINKVERRENILMRPNILETFALNDVQLKNIFRNARFAIKIEKWQFICLVNKKLLTIILSAKEINSEVIYRQL